LTPGCVACIWIGIAAMLRVSLIASFAMPPPVRMRRAVSLRRPRNCINAQ
jgi:hypothetical protein